MRVEGHAKHAIYVSTGPRLDHYEVDVDALALRKHGSVMLAANVQYAWPHVTSRYLYVASSNGGPRIAGDRHLVSAFRIDPDSGEIGRAHV